MMLFVMFRKMIVKREVRILCFWFRPPGKPGGSDLFIKILCTQNAMRVCVVPSAVCFATYSRFELIKSVSVIFYSKKCAIIFPINRSLPCILPVFLTLALLTFLLVALALSSATVVLALSTTFLSFTATSFLLCCRLMLHHFFL